MKKYIRNSNTFLSILFITGLFHVKAEAITIDSLKKNIHFELSFGQSLLFISNSDVVNIRNTSNIVMPTSSMLFFSEFRPAKKIRILVFFNLPKEAKQFLVNGQLVYEKASQSIGSGLEFKIFQVNIDSRSKIEFEVGPLLSTILDYRNSRVVPIIAGRIKIMRGENFLMYIGWSYTFGVNTLGMFYGTGSVF